MHSITVVEQQKQNWTTPFNINKNTSIIVTQSECSQTGPWKATDPSSKHGQSWTLAKTNTA